MLTAQIRRAAVSIPSNIAEGQGRHTTKEFVQFLSVARGSKCERETQIELARRIGYLSRSECNNILQLCREVGKMLNALSLSLIAPKPPTTKN